MKINKRIEKLKAELTGRMRPKARRWLVARLKRLEEMQKARREAKGN